MDMLATRKATFIGQQSLVPKESKLLLCLLLDDMAMQLIIVT